jgi:hypothetical protein
MGIATSKIYDEYIKSIEDNKRKEIKDNCETKMKLDLDLCDNATNNEVKDIQ